MESVLRAVVHHGPTDLSIDEAPTDAIDQGWTKAVPNPAKG